MTKTKLIISMTFLAAIANVYAAPEQPDPTPKLQLTPFIGAGGGFTFYGLGTNGKLADNSIFKKTSTSGGFGYSATVGMNIIQYFGAYVRYTDYGTAKDSANTKLMANSTAFMIRGIVPFDAFLATKTHISTFLDLGYADINYTFSPSNNAIKSDSGKKGAFAYNIGVGYNVTPHLQISLQTGYNATTDVDNNNFFAGLFGGNLSYSF